MLAKAASAPAGFHARPVDIDPIDLLRPRPPYPNGNRRFADLDKQRLATLWREHLESATPSIMVSEARITAAATTGPASAPTPTSSTPAIIATPLRQSPRSRTKSGNTRTRETLALQAALSPTDGLPGQEE
jgi:hypothetical protein